MRRVERRRRGRAPACRAGGAWPSYWPKSAPLATPHWPAAPSGESPRANCPARRTRPPPTAAAAPVGDQSGGSERNAQPIGRPETQRAANRAARNA
eukprot:3105316-Pyramimonas_sp.AAC.1